MSVVGAVTLRHLYRERGSILSNLTTLRNDLADLTKLIESQEIDLTTLVLEISVAEKTFPDAAALFAQSPEPAS